MGRIEMADLKLITSEPWLVCLIEGIQTLWWGKESNGAFPSWWHWFASFRAVKGSFAAPSGAPLTAAARCEPRPTMEEKGKTASSLSLTNWALFPSARGSKLKKVLDTAGIVIALGKVWKRRSRR